MGILVKRAGAIAALAAMLALSACAPATDASIAAITATVAPTDSVSSVDVQATEPAHDSAVAVTDRTATDGTALAVLASLPVQPEASNAGYSRDQFGAAWLDVDHNGCDTRNDILARDLASELLSGSCIVIAGSLISAYTGALVDFVRGQATSGKVQIDHVVALANAWRTGAQLLTQMQRESLANDPLNLQAIEGSLNASKSDKDAASWLPPLLSYRCEYVARQISVKKTYALWVTQAERDVMFTVLSTCPTQPALASDFTPTISTDVGAVQPAPQSDLTVSYANCAAVRSAGKAPLRVGDPGYSTKLDRDGDGVACE